ncbi:MAG: hypothetical protein COA57_15630 [Flavobacteriales bacterium]|nr:choice-of-anchor L domain-containing protein [Bacteroidales bacterium AH-315-I05]PCJ79455.1 MAG: hypothetical protein COA57_15630 [Flavobacteriales bacterium]
MTTKKLANCAQAGSNSHWLFALLLSILILPFFVQAQLVLDTTMTPTQLVQNVLLGQGVTVSNVTFNGQSGDSLNVQIAHFDATNANAGLPNGLFLSTGHVNVSLGPNNQGGATIAVANTGTDPDLAAISGAGANDPAVLEFDFIPQGDTLRFRYVFASEEYLEFVNAGFNDAFGFFISGPGFNGPYTNNAENIALIPSTTTPVTIDNVNNVSNSAFYVDNGDGATPPYNSSPTYIQFDGFTTVLDALALVQCNQQYHIKLAIADAGDSILDSGVFLEGGSFSSNDVQISLSTGVPSITVDSVTVDSAIIEGCTQAVFTFTRSDTTSDLTITYTIGGNAIMGLDYDTIPDSVTIGQGQFSANLVITPLADTLIEGTDTITIGIQKITPCGDTILIQSYVYILEDYTLNVVANNAFSNCPGDSVMVVVATSGGIPDYTYLWSNGETSDTIYVTPTQVDTLIVSAIDSCAIGPFSDSVFIDIQIIPVQLTVANATSSCPGDSVILMAFASAGTGSGYQYIWNTGDTTSIITVAPTTDSSFIVTATDYCGADSISDTATVTIQIVAPAITALSDTIIFCAGDTVPFSAIGSGGTGTGYQYTWSTGDTGSLITTYPVTDSTFFVTVTDDCGILSSTDSVTVTIQPPQLNLVLSNDTTVDCQSDLATLIASGSNGTPPFIYTWSNGDVDDTITVNPSINTTYYVTMTDDCGAAPVTDSIVVNIQTHPLLMLAVNDDSVQCAGDAVTLNATASGGNPGYQYSWSTGDTGTGITVNPNSTTVYILTVTDQCGTDTTASATVNVPIYPPLALNFAGNTTVQCVGDGVTLQVGATGGTGTGYVYTWSWDTIVVSGTQILDTPLVTMEYIVQVIDDCGETHSDSVAATVPVYDPLQVTVMQDTAICEGEQITITISVSGGSGSYDYDWNGSGSIAVAENGYATVMPLNTGNYDITINEPCGDEAAGDISVTFKDCEIEIPNVFTPNADGENDYFVIDRLQYYPFSEIIIYNRWGKKVYENSNYQNDWDGRHYKNGLQCKDGVYYFVLTVSEELETGYVHLIRD